MLLPRRLGVWPAPTRCLVWEILDWLFNFCRILIIGRGDWGRRIRGTFRIDDTKKMCCTVGHGGVEGQIGMIRRWLTERAGLAIKVYNLSGHRVHLIAASDRLAGAASGGTNT